MRDWSAQSRVHGVVGVASRLLTSIITTTLNNTLYLNPHPQHCLLNPALKSKIAIFYISSIMRSASNLIMRFLVTNPQFSVVSVNVPLVL